MPQGAYAEYVICWEKLVMPKPGHLTWVEAASIPENFLTGGILVLPECPSAGLTSGLSLSGPHTLQQPPEGWRCSHPRWCLGRWYSCNTAKQTLRRVSCFRWTFQWAWPIHLSAARQWPPLHPRPRSSILYWLCRAEPPTSQITKPKIFPQKSRKWQKAEVSMCWLTSSAKATGIRI